MTVTNKDIKQWEGLVFNIVNRFRDKVFKYKTYVDYDELEQIGMIALYKALKGYNSTKGTFKNYAITIITRAIYKQYQFQKKIETHSDIDEFYNIANLDNLDDNIDSDLIESKLTKMIKKLPIKDISKQILYLRVMGKSLLEIADKMGVSYWTVSGIIRLHKDKIKKLLEEDI